MTIHSEHQFTINYNISTKSVAPTSGKGLTEHIVFIEPLVPNMDKFNSLCDKYRFNPLTIWCDSKKQALSIANSIVECFQETFSITEDVFQKEIDFYDTKKIWKLYDVFSNRSIEEGTYVIDNKGVAYLVIRMLPPTSLGHPGEIYVESVVTKIKDKYLVTNLNLIWRKV